MKRRSIELLAPAKNAEIGMEAVLHGADAVYIGAPQFSARAAAGNSLEDIGRLVRFAHGYHARVYVALNTVLTDAQLPEAEAMIGDLYRLGVDAVIVQDMGIAELNLPPVALHASTQTDNRTAEKVSFLEKSGFSQVVLARELTVAQMAEIGKQTGVTLEAFVHGALCVSYSGQCYISEACKQRSANRGECAQFCRLPYRLEDAEGKVISRNSHLLSLKDLNRGESLEAMIDAGISSFKIEGRLKDLSYVKNVVAWYRAKLDAILAKRPDLKRASSGVSKVDFVPAPGKSFNRGFTPYYIERKRNERTDLTNPVSPKSQGEYVGVVKSLYGNHFTVAGIVQLHNGDGLCYENEQGGLVGFRVNRVDENRVYPAEMPKLKPKTKLYRNFDQDFERMLSKNTAERKVGVKVHLYEVPFGFAIQMSDADGYSATLSFAADKNPAQTPQKENITRQLSKLGNTIFACSEATVTMQTEWFLPASQLAEWRRQTTEKLLSVRMIAHRPEIRRKSSETVPYPEKKLSYRGNVANEKAKEFYLKHGVEEVAPAFELKPEKGVPLMITKHCIRFSLGMCPVHQNPATELKEPLYIINNNYRFRLSFNCKRCEMEIYAADNE